MKWKIDEIRKLREISFVDEMLDLKAGLMGRDSEILDISKVMVTGSIRFENGLYDLSVQATYEITLPSSRSLEPVKLQQMLDIFETYSDKAEELENEEIFPIEGDEISLDEAVADNILLEIPIRRLTDDEESSDEIVQGNSWTVMSEEEFQRQQEEKKRQNSPFSGLGEIFKKDENE
ncbi:MAG: YceD family protein [Streptococcaceae bacterium]|jgi:uncharacterized protein|nr:YceD family protein [Streptococcaceae bacterium]